ncbi:major facilitator superfamily domain-containing protein [Lophiotrema nucula]|uniref:Major facilitator superfamily domain-containing protein n=1 Tax=Lophiotrema nucula TaxID=690887 RepID=A0A6A5YZR0_9PLEO|nr:major facilitator superfamily domain-containing protein [Lophiotrema nucula]
MAFDRKSDDLNKLGEDEQITEVNSNSTSQASDAERTLWQNIKKYRKVVGYTFAMTSAILLYGYDNVVVGTVSGMPKFQQDFGEQLNGQWILPSSWLALWNVSSPIGAMIGSLAGGWFQDRVGRRMALGISSFLSAVAVAVMYTSYLPEDINGRRGCFFAGKLFQGMAVGAVMAATQTYMSEILPPVLRGSGMALFPVFTLLGQLTGALVIYGSLGASKGYTIAFYSQWPFSFVPIFVALFMPESPAYYVRKRKIDKALKSQARLDPIGINTKAVVERIQADIEHEESIGRSTFKECFHKRNLRRTFIVMWANSLTTVFGLQMLAKASYFLQIVGMNANLSIIFLILGIVLGLIANAVSVWVTARVGRRPLINITLFISSLLWLSMGIANCFKGGAVPWWTAVSMMLTIIVCGVGVWPASFAVAAETSSLQLRAKTQGIGWFVSAFTSAASGIALPYIFNPDEGNLRGKIGFTYVGSCLIGLAVSWYIVPEMKGRTIGEIDRMFELNLKTKEFKNWRGEERQATPPAQPWV